MKNQNIVQIVGYKNSGKTTLLCRMTRWLSEQGYKVATLKHDVHGIDMDQPYTDTWKHQQSGAWMTAITSPHQSAWLKPTSVSLESLLEPMYEADWILIEGFKNAHYRKIVMLRSEDDLPLLDQCTKVVAVCQLGVELPVSIYGLPVFPPHEVSNILQAIIDDSIED